MTQAKNGTSKPRKRKKSEDAPVPAPLPPRTPEEALVAAHYGRRRLDRPVRFEKKGDAVQYAGDKDLARARLGALLHVSSSNQLITLLGRAADALGVKDPVEALDTLVGIVHGIGPQDHLEALLATQMAATHATALEMLRRSHGELSTDQVDSCVTRAARLMRTFTAQVTALKDYRNKGQQTVTVQHVDVRDGGQAIVGKDVVLNKTGGGGS